IRRRRTRAVKDGKEPDCSMATSNEELARPRAGASSATRAQNSEARSRRAATHASRPAPSDEMDSSWMAVRHRCAKLSLVSQLKPFQKESTHELYDCRG